MVRTPCCDKSGLRKGTWTPEEDRKLTAYVTRFGCWNWRQLPKFAGLSRCGKSCRLRWMNYLRPDLKHGNYTKEEDELIIKLHESLGNRWSAIAAQLPGRTDNEIKNHWHTSLKNASKEASAELKRRSKNRKRRTDKPEENPPASFTTREILESSEFSPQPTSSWSSSSVSSSSSDQLCSPSFSLASAAGTNVPGDYDDLMAEIAGESAGSFWTEPFLTDNDSTLKYYPPSPFAAEVLLWSYDYFEDNMNTLIW